MYRILCPNINDSKGRRWVGRIYLLKMSFSPLIFRRRSCNLNCYFDDFRREMKKIQDIRRLFVRPNRQQWNETVEYVKSEVNYAGRMQEKKNKAGGEKPLFPRRHVPRRSGVDCELNWTATVRWKRETQKYIPFFETIESLSIDSLGKGKRIYLTPNEPKGRKLKQLRYIFDHWITVFEM